MMNLFELWSKISAAMEQGKALENASTWANRTQATQVLLVIIMAISSLSKALGWDIDISGTDAAAIAQGVAVVGFYVTTKIQQAANPYAGKAPK